LIDLTDWELKFAARGYKEGENPGKSGSTRIVWTNKDWFLVLKLFDDNGNFPKYPRTLKFWQTENFRNDLMAWTSAQNRFEPTSAELETYTSILGDMWSTLPLAALARLWK